MFYWIKSGFNAAEQFGWFIAEVHKYCITFNLIETVCCVKVPAGLQKDLVS